MSADINLGNIVFRSTNLSGATTERILEVLGEPYFERLERLDGKPLDHGQPEYIVEAASWDKWLFEEKEDLCILDLGEAFVEGKAPERLAQPGALQAPETFFIGKFDHTVDLWSAGCMVSDGNQMDDEHSEYSPSNADIQLCIWSVPLLSLRPR